MMGVKRTSPFAFSTAGPHNLRSMAEDFDPNKMAVEFLEKNVGRVLSLTAAGARKASNALRVRLESTYAVYLTRILDRHGRGKSFFIRSEPIPLYDFFVPLDLATQRRTLSRPGIASLCGTFPLSIITGTGGCGKSMMMRHFLVDSVVDGQKTPIFLELRQLNNSTEVVRDALFRTIRDNGLDVDIDYFEKALNAGHFVILLDGFDELALATRERISKEIRQLAIHYPANWIVMSSRPDDALQGWDDFARLDVAPLSLDDAVDLVTRLHFDEAIKSGFIADMRATLFSRHESFLSNPLLLSIMLFTYIDVAHIPDKLTTFYEQAYASLFQRHDALKGGFQRERKSGLDIQNFGRAFAAFSLVSYDKREFSFSWDRALDLLEQSKELCSVGFSQADVLADAVQAVCLLREDGLELTYAHRSFQEYFVARYIQAAAPERKNALVARIIPSVQADNVMGLLYELDPYVVEQQYFLPKLAFFRKEMKLKQKVGISHFWRYIKLLFSDFKIIEDEGPGIAATIRNSEMFAAQAMIWSRHPELRTRWTPAYRKRASEALRAVFIAEFGEDAEIETNSLRTTSPFVKALAASEGSWGLRYVSDLFVVEDNIRARHAATLGALDKVLLNPQGQRRAIGKLGLRK